MARASTKRVAFVQERRRICSPSCPHLIYDEPHVFRVRSERPSNHFYPCETCLKNAHRQQASTANNSHSKRCSRLPPAPIDTEPANRPDTSRMKRTPRDCNWDNFMKNKSRYAIQTPYAYCNLTNYEQDLENRPPFVNYGERYNDRRSGEKRTYNSLAVHQLKHREVNEQRAKSFFREQRLRQQAEEYFREMNRRRFDDPNPSSSMEDRHNDQSTQE